jgi:toxin-antitoxin system PIN domain toxin
VIVLDVNVVLAAHRTDHPHHAIARPWLDRLAAGTESFGVPAPVWTSFLRIATSRRVFVLPTPLAEAFDFIRAVAGQPNHVAIEPGVRHLDLLEAACTEGEATGDLVADAFLVALATEHGSSLASFDRDFARFPGVDWILPAVS